ncbi:E3 ubiquitin-protein ligase HUWE1-like [Uloborus diversus]|uniref:E3 ubiquitin-protein ligase HUWE1-like n=1 Tax=Uloborus diversus TaxID=327109 RepID=UPI0024098731|nr:E3 ubiquitin-protein ligase HUWE1-like [Uloborus diversus]
MKIDRTKLRKSSSEVPTDCKALIDKLKSCSHDELLEELSKVKIWNCGKCELYHWIDVLDAFDYILEVSCEKTKENQWCLPCDAPGSEKKKQLLLCVLQFTALLIEHSFSRHFYNSMEHLTTLLSSSDIDVVLAVLNLLYVFSKRSNFITRLSADKRQTLLLRLLYLAESWGGKENGFGLAECCQNLPISSYPPSASTLHFEYYAESHGDKIPRKQSNAIIAIHIDHVDKIPYKTPSQIMEELVDKYAVPEDKQMQLFTHIRLAYSFSNYTKRMLCVQARLQALSVLVYCNAVPDNVNSLLYNGLIEELVDVLELQDNSLIEIKAAALRTLTSIIHLDRNPKLNAIIDATGAASYHGFLPVLVRSCIQALTEPGSDPFPLPFATALFSFLYHLASYENGGEALVSCGMMESLLKVINWYSTETEHITFVTRAVRVIDLITNLDMQAFQTHGGLASFIQRLETEVNVCRQDQPFVINPVLNLPVSAPSDVSAPSNSPANTDNEVAMEIDSMSPDNRLPEQVEKCEDALNVESNSFKKGLQCFPQRAALLKSMLNFLKKSIQDPAFSDSIRHLMDGTLPQSLKHIISNAEYYGPSLFLLATDVVTVYVFQEPSLLPSMQDNGLTDVVLHALLVKEVPATREVLASLPNVFSALCLNSRGLQSFVACKPFEKLFRVLVSPEYLPAMRRRRSSDPIGDAASNLGNAMDELMRHQPSLRTDATAAIIKLLEELCAMGRDPKFICSRPTAKPETIAATVTRIAASLSNEAGSSDEEDDDDEDTGGGPVQGSLPKPLNDRCNTGETNSYGSKTAVPLVDYILNVMRFVDAILSNNSTDDHCREFVRQKGLVPLMAILGLPNLPIDFPVTPTCQAISSVCKSILNLAHEPQVLKQGLLHLNEVLQSLEHLHRPLDPPGGSVLLEELISAPNVNDATLSAQSTPLLHYMSAAHAYIIMFIHVCRTGQTDIRTISVSHWGSELGLSVLKGLSSLYTSLVWESTVLLALCSNDSALAEDCQFGRQQLEKLLPKDFKCDKDESSNHSSGEFGSNGVSSAMETLSTNGSSLMDVDEACHCSSSDDVVNGNPQNGEKPKAKAFHAQIKLIKPLLSGASRLGRALAELFGLLVKLCVGSPMRQRRGQQIPPSPSSPSPAARAVASALTRLLAMGLSWEPPPASPVPKFRLTFYICSVGFTSPMLFDERKYPYHLMLQKFLSCGGLDAFFNTFRWALTCGNKVPIEDGLEHPELSDGTGEFLDAWLMLLEKMVNPRNVLESPHTLPSKVNAPGYTNFSPILYLVHIHKRAFESIMYLWDRKPLLVYGERIAESILAIICHLLKGETIIKERLTKGDEVQTPVPQAVITNTAAAAASANRIITRSRRFLENDDTSVNQDHLVQLVDMGFSRSLATEALLNTNSLEQATDYLLSYPSSLGRGSAVGPPPPSLGMDWEMSEEDQMLRAIAMSLGENVLVSTNQVEGESNKTDEQKEYEFEQKVEEPLSSPTVDGFTENIVEGCLKLADVLPETVYRCCDLLISVAARNGEKWRNRFLIERLLNEMHVHMYSLLKHLKSGCIPKDKKGWGIGAKLPWVPAETRFAIRLHLFTLIFEEMKIPCATLIENRELIGFFIRILELTAECMKKLQDEATPKWLPFLILLIDLYEKAALMSARKAPLLLAPKRQWKWFDDRSGKWNNYTMANNKMIDDAYKAGETSLRFTAGRRNYTVQLTTMVQINEETGNWRPIMLTTDSKEEKEKTKSKEETKGSELSINLDDTLDELNSSDNGSQSLDSAQLTTQPVQLKVITRLSHQQCKSLIRMCVTLMKVHLEPDTLHSVMRLALRLTRHHEIAAMFASMGGAKILLTLTQPYAFIGFTSLTTLLFRHILEDPLTLANAMEKVIRSAAVGTSSMFVSKEMHYVFRVLGPAACRDPELFCTVASNTLRLAILPLSNRDEGDSRFNSNCSVQMLKPSTGKTNLSSLDLAEEPHAANYLIFDLLNALIAKPVEVPEEATTPLETNTDTTSSDQQSPLREVNASDLLNTDDDDGLVIPLTMPSVDGFGDSTESINNPRDSKSTKDPNKENKSESSSLKNIPIIRKSGICRLLAELVRSYPHVAKIITDHYYTVGASELVTEGCSALAFILDNLLHSSQTAGDKETPALARVLIASIASCTSCVEAQNALVAEVRLALLRALALPESTDKHTRVQALTGLISTMIESCPSTTQNPAPGCTLRSQTITMNNIVRILLKKGVVVDLAKIPHYLDLSSPHMAATVNSALKPLETLSRIVNLPSGHVTNKSRNKTTNSSSEVRESVPEAMEEDTSSARCSSDVSLPYRAGTGNAAENRIDPALDGIMNEILENPNSEGERRSPADAFDAWIRNISMLPTEDYDNLWLEGGANHSLLQELHRNCSEPTPEEEDAEEVARDRTNPTQTSAVVSMRDPDITVTVEMDNHGNPQLGSRRSNSFGERNQDDQNESSDSESNSESGHSHSEDDAERDERPERDDDDDDDDTSRFDVADEYPGLDFFQVQDRDDSLFFHLEEVFPTSGGSPVIFGGTDAVRTFQIPVVTDEATNGNENPAPTVPPAPRSVTTVHPLLVRHTDLPCSLQPRVHRRQRGYRPTMSNHTWHMYTSSNGNSASTTRQPNPPVILQRLLGPNTAQDLLQLTSNYSSHPQSSASSRVVFANSDFRILATEDEVFEIQEQSSNVSGENSGTLAAIPSPLNRWAEESRVLDGDSIHDCVTGLKPTIIKCLEAHRDDELSERREKRRKLQDKCNEKSDATLVKDKESFVVVSSTPQPNGEARAPSMEIAEPASQFESNISATLSMPILNLEEDATAQDLRSLSTERLAASIVEQVLGPALAITSNSGSYLSPTTTSETTSSLANLVTSQDTAAPSVLSCSGNCSQQQCTLCRLSPSNTSSWVNLPSSASRSSANNGVFCSLSIPMDTSETDAPDFNVLNRPESPSVHFQMSSPVEGNRNSTNFSGHGSVPTSADLPTHILRRADPSVPRPIPETIDLLDSSPEASLNLSLNQQESSEDSDKTYNPNLAVETIPMDVYRTQQMGSLSPDEAKDFDPAVGETMERLTVSSLTFNEQRHEPSGMLNDTLSSPASPDENKAEVKSSNVLPQALPISEEAPSGSPSVIVVSDSSDENKTEALTDPFSDPSAITEPICYERDGYHVTMYPEMIRDIIETGSGHLLNSFLAQQSNSTAQNVPVTQTENAPTCNSLSNAANQSRIPAPSLMSDDALPCERPAISGNDAPPDFSNVLSGGDEIPEGVDPSFLAALPDNIRQEVIAEQLRLQRLRQRTQTVANENSTEGASFTEVNPEFLAALPPNIQEEVLAQQRAEQQRLAAQNSNPDIPVDPTSFIQTLPQGLRQQVLADMDDSLLALLPPELASEAHALRRELEARHRQIQERFFSSHAGTALSRILRSAGRVGARYTIHSLPQRGQWTWNALSPRGTSSPSGNPAAVSGASLTSSMRLRGRYLLDHEALACLLVLLFVDEPQLNTGRLHRVLRNLCHHGPTRNWVVKSLLSILERTKDYQVPETPTDSHRHKRTTKTSSTAEYNAAISNSSKSDSANKSGQPSWLSISLDAALGCRTNVFQIRRLTTAHRRANERHAFWTQGVLSPNIPLVTIHPLASPVICRHVLDTLISLAKSFPVHFLPDAGKEEKIKESSCKGDQKFSKPAVTPSKIEPKVSNAKNENALRTESDFWDVLIRLDSLSTTNRKGKTYRAPYGSSSSASDEEVKSPAGFENTPLAQLIGLLAHPVVKRSSVLTDRLLRLLALISLALPEPKTIPKDSKSNSDFRHQNTEGESPASDLNSRRSFFPRYDIKKGPKTLADALQIKSGDKSEEEDPMKHYLKLAVEVLTSKTCSEEGLEDATALLLRLSRGCLKTRRTVLYLLLDGARQLGQSVCENIQALMHEMRNAHTSYQAEKSFECDDHDYDGKVKGTIQDRFTHRAVVITAPKVKGRSGRELQLQSMSALTSKSSSQAFFLRILKVIIQLTESTQLATKVKPLPETESAENGTEENVPSTSSQPFTSDSSLSVLNTATLEASNSFSNLWDMDFSVAQGNSKVTSESRKESDPIHLSSQLRLDVLWNALSDCLSELAETPDHHAVLVLQPAVEAFFLVHASSEKENKKKDGPQDSSESEMAHLQDAPPMSPLNVTGALEQSMNTSEILSASTAVKVSSDKKKFLKFAETHRTVLNQILRQSTTPLADGPFSVLVDHTRVLDFDVKRRYFRQELDRMDEGSRREDLAVHVRREHVFEDSFRELHRRTPEDWKNRFYIVFEGEEGQDAGGLLREWYTIISREIFNPMYALFTTSPGDRVTYMINSSSHCNSNHLSYFKFVGRVIAKAVYDNKLLESYFTRSFYKHILGKCVKYTDMESEDYSFYQGLVFLLEHAVKELGYELTFSVEVQEFGVTEIRDLKPDGRNLPVCEENKHDYVKLVCQEKMTGAIRKQLKAFLEGFYEIIPKRLISIFNEQELELLISGLPNIDIDDLKANTEYHKYQPTSLQIQWFWRALRSFDQADRANFLQFVTGTSKVPLQGFAALEGMNGTQKFQIHRDDRSTDRLPSAHTCFNQLDLPAYETYDKLRSMLLKAIHECSEGFGFA